MGSDQFDCRQDWLFGGDAEEMGPASRTGPRSRDGLTSHERERPKTLERENRELRRANEILRKASAYFAQVELDRRQKVWSHSSMRTGRSMGSGRCAQYCRRAPSTYYEQKAREADPARVPKRIQRDRLLGVEIRRVWEENFYVHGVRKVWRQLNREFTASRPDELRVTGFTSVATWKGFVYLAFVIYVFARMIVGRRVSVSMSVELTLDAFEQALWVRTITAELVHHNDLGTHYLAIRYSERLADEGINPSAGSAGESYDNALAESVIGLFKTEVIRRKGSWKSLESGEYAALEWVDLFNNRRIREPIGNIPPVERESEYYAMEEAPVLVAGLIKIVLRDIQGSSCFLVH